MYPKVSVVILNYNTADCLRSYLPSVLQSTYPNFEVVVADNGSKDESITVLKEQFPQVTLLQFHKNLGYAGGYNKALKLLESTYFVLLNSDVKVEPGWLEPLVSFAQKNKEVGALQPCIADINRESFYEYAGAAGGFIDRYGYPFCRGRIGPVLEPISEDYQHPTPVFWASGACLFIRSEVFESLGGFDARFFAHMEEIDLCWRMQNQGYELFCIPESKVFHLGGGTLNRASPQKTYLNFHNGLAMLAKNLHPSERLLTIIMRLILDHFAAYSYLFRGKVTHFFAVAKAHFRFITGYKKWLRLGPTQNRLKTKALKGMYGGSIILAYLLKRLRHFRDLEWKK